MPEQATNTIVSDAEVEAALVDAQAGDIPNLDDNSGQGVVPVPITSHLRPVPRLTERATEPSAATAEAQPAAAEPAAAANPVPAPAAAVVARVGPGERVYRLIDSCLWVVNRPFAWLGPGGRALTGWLALTTIVISLLAMFLLPILVPRRDFTVELHRQACQARPAASAPASAK